MTIDDVLGELVDHGFEDLDEDRALAVINETLSDAAARELWPTLLTTAVLSFDPGFNTSSDYPDDVATIHSVYRLGGREKTIPYRRIDDARDQAGLTTLGPSLFYTLLGNELRVYGAPDTQVGIDYFRVPEAVEASTLEDGIWLPRQYHRGIIVNGAVYKLYLMEDDVELAREFKQLYEEAIQNARTGLHMQNLESDYIHVVDSADWDYD